MMRQDRDRDRDREVMVFTAMKADTHTQ
jgi:hypothetical protein